MGKTYLSVFLSLFLLAGCNLFTPKPPEHYSDLIQQEPTVLPTVQEQPTAVSSKQPIVEKPGASATFPQQVLIKSVPFTVQAPFAEWDDPRHQDGCEEASMTMAMKWVKGDSLITPEEAKKSIENISAFELEQYGYYNDTDAEDTAKVIKAYFGYSNVETKDNITADDIRKELATGNIILVPMNGQKLGNPHFKQPGPDRHMVVVIGYDIPRDVFIVQDPGTKFGEEYVYRTSVFMNAATNYRSGNHLPELGEPGKGMVVVKK